MCGGVVRGLRGLGVMGWGRGWFRLKGGFEEKVWLGLNGGVGRCEVVVVGLEFRGWGCGRG